MSRVTVIIVNYKTGELAVRCLASLAEDGWIKEHGRVIVVDNASGDGSTQTLDDAINTRGWTAWARLVIAESNGGFAAGNNLAIQQAINNPLEGESDYLMLLNPDATIQKCAVQALADFMDDHDRVGIAGSRLLDERGRVQSAAHCFPTALGELEGMMRVGVVSRVLSRWRISPPATAEAHACDWVSGAALMIRADVIREIGMLDEKFFLYFEEVDWCRRAKSVGWQIWHVPTSQVLHMEGASTGVKEISCRRTPHWYQSRRRYFKKHHGLPGLIAADICWSLGWAGNRLARLLRPGRPTESDPVRYARDLLGGDLRSITERV